MRPLRFEADRLAPTDGLVAGLLSRHIRNLFPPGVLDIASEPEASVGSTGTLLGDETFSCASDAARERLAAVRAGKGLVVTAGQQPQLLAGPLYVLYKAFTAVRVAAEVESRSGVPCLPVFWIAGDDHDWAEVAAAEFLDREEGLRKLSLDPPAGRVDRAVGPSPIPPTIRPLLEEFFAAVEETPGGGHWGELLRESYVPGRTFTEAFTSAAASLLRNHPVAFLDSAHDAVRRASVPLLAEVLERRTEVDEALAEGAEAVVEKGYEPQLRHMQNAIPVFHEGPGGRFRIRNGPRGIQTERGGPWLSPREVLERIRTEPERFSPSAALRPVLESKLLPVAVTILGPGEIAYWSQLAPLFDRLDVRMPQIRPRDSWRVIEPRVARLLEKVGVSADDIREAGDVRRDIVLRGRPADVDRRLAELDGRVRSAYESLGTAMDEELPGLRSAVGKSRKRALDAVQELRGTIDSAVRDRERVALRQLDRIEAHLRPGGDPQERRLNTWSYLLRFGQDFIDEAAKAAGIVPEEAGETRADDVAGAARQE